MQKYVCDMCGWEYDPAVGYPEAGIAPEHPGRMYLTVLNALFAG